MKNKAVSSIFNIKVKNSRILIIDDSTDILDLISNILILESFIPLAINDPVKALSIVNKKIDAIILDLMMPKMNGIEFLKNIREKSDLHHIPIIVLTAKLNSQEEIAELFMRGANDYITKPFFKDELVARLRLHIGLKIKAEKLLKANKKLNLRNIELLEAVKREEILNEKILERTIELQEANKKIEQLNKALEYSASHDVLTEILNRGAILTYLENDIRRAKRLKNKISLMIFDIDHFKMFNDSYGHLTGDFILKHLSALVKEYIRDIDLLGRYGGEEFIIILPDTNITQATVLAKRILNKVASHNFTMDKLEMKISISIGITEYIQDESIDKFIERTDLAMYDAKKAGRNCIRKR